MPSAEAEALVLLTLGRISSGLRPWVGWERDMNRKFVALLLGAFVVVGTSTAQEFPSEPGEGWSPPGESYQEYISTSTLIGNIYGDSLSGCYNFCVDEASVSVAECGQPDPTNPGWNPPCQRTALVVYNKCNGWCQASYGGTYIGGGDG